MFKNLIANLRHSIYENRIENLKNLKKPTYTKFSTRVEDKKSLHIVYVMNHVGICGGSKVIFEHANGLKKLGAEVTIISNFPKPNWFNIEANYICVPFELEVTRHIPDCDIIVATYWEHVSACVEVGIAPVIYFEQGDFHLYEWDSLDENKKSIVYKQFQLPFDIMTVSSETASIIKKIFKRDAVVVPNALNESIFYPKEGIKDKKSMLIVGREETKFKGTDDLKAVFLRLKEKGYDLELNWVAQTEPKNKLGNVYKSPSQELLGQLYRDAFVYVCGSYYESFPLPPLEAMASGTPVVTTNNIGINEYAKDQINCLMVEPGDIEGLTKNVEKLLNDQQLYQTLQTNGIKTSEKYKWNIILSDLLHYFQECSMYKVDEKYKVEDWDIHLDLKEEDRLKLNHFLKFLDADLIQFPVLYEVIQGMPFTRWETVASRKEPLFNNKVEKINIRLVGIETAYYLKNKYSEGIRLFIKEEFLLALKYFMNRLQETTIGAMEHGLLTKWVSLCLFELKMDDMLAEYLDEALKVHYKYTDLYFIKAMMHFERKENHLAADLLNICITVQDGFFYDEHIAGIADITKVWLDNTLQRT